MSRVRWVMCVDLIIQMYTYHMDQHQPVVKQEFSDRPTAYVPTTWCLRQALLYPTNMAENSFQLLIFQNGDCESQYYF